MAVFSERRRFMAGARCVHCGREDLVVVFHRQGRDYRECVACGSRDVLGASAIAPEAAPEAVRLIDRAGDGGDPGSD